MTYGSALDNLCYVRGGAKKNNTHYPYKKGVFSYSYIKEIYSI